MSQLRVPDICANKNLNSFVSGSQVQVDWALPGDEANSARIRKISPRVVFKRVRITDGVVSWPTPKFTVNGFGDWIILALFYTFWGAQQGFSPRGIQRFRPGRSRDHAAHPRT
jgi:hypothetical protein